MYVLAGTCEALNSKYQKHLFLRCGAGFSTFWEGRQPNVASDKSIEFRVSVMCLLNVFDGEGDAKTI